MQHRMIFDEVNAVERSDSDFDSFSYKHHQLYRSPLIASNVNCVNDFCLDYMHLVCLGVVKRMLLFIKAGPRICKLSAGQLDQISTKLKKMSGLMPNEFARQPRGLDELKRWKATEFRQFLLYTGCILLKDVLPDGNYIHFLSLSIAMMIMLDSNKEKRENNLNYAKDLLVFFVTNSSKYYGPTFVSCNGTLDHHWMPFLVFHLKTTCRY